MGSIARGENNVSGLFILRGAALASPLYIEGAAAPSQGPAAKYPGIAVSPYDKLPDKTGCPVVGHT